MRRLRRVRRIGRAVLDLPETLARSEGRFVALASDAAATELRLRALEQHAEDVDGAIEEHDGALARGYGVDASFIEAAKALDSAAAFAVLPAVPPAVQRAIDEAEATKAYIDARRDKGFAKCPRCERVGTDLMMRAGCKDPGCPHGTTPEAPWVPADEPGAA